MATCLFCTAHSNPLEVQVNDHGKDLKVSVNDTNSGEDADDGDINMFIFNIGTKNLVVPLKKLIFCSFLYRSRRMLWGEVDNDHYWQTPTGQKARRYY